MGENKHTISDLYQMQSLPLSAKIRMTERRIYDWIDYFGEDGVAISFSGGKDSTVLMDIIRNRMGYKDIPAVFVDVPTQFPELKEFALTWDNVEVLKPKISFIEVCEKYGFPIISKEVSENIYTSIKYLEKVDCEKPYSEKAYEFDKQYMPHRLARILGIFEKNWKEKKTNNTFNGDLWCGSLQQTKWKFMLDANFSVSSECCKIMKKKPLHEYEKKTGRKPITAQMADESRLRLDNWLKNGCNGFDMKEPISNPMSFWTEQDVLLYIKLNRDDMLAQRTHDYEDTHRDVNMEELTKSNKEWNYPICSVYGDIVEDWNSVTDVKGQLTISDLVGFEDCGKFDANRPKLKTTGCSRTGCMLCGFGCHLEKPGEGRFEMLKKTHPGMYNLLDVVKNNGVTMREAIEWINEHGGTDIKL